MRRRLPLITLAAIAASIGATMLWLPACIGSCFAAGTPISTPSGPVPIEDLEVGDIVYSFDFSRGVRVPARVTETFRHEGRSVRTVSLTDGRSVRVTAEHPFWADGAWVDAEDLGVGSVLSVSDGEGAAPMSVDTFGAEEHGVTVYNIEVEGHHNYFAAGMLVHNKSTTAPDDDGDGFFSYEDCDDTDPTITDECFRMDTGTTMDAGRDAGPSCAPLGGLSCFDLSVACCQDVAEPTCTAAGWTCPGDTTLTHDGCRRGCSSEDAGSDAATDAADDAAADAAIDTGVDAAADAASDAAPDAP